MGNRDIVVIGASAGGLDVLKDLVRQLPKDFQASLFIVWHISPNVRSVLPQILDKAGPLRAAHATDGEEITPGRIYVAPPDHHMLIEHGRIRVSKGPKENRFRPAIDPLFRSAAYVYGTRVIGVILSGYLDDGTTGLWTIKLKGGIAVVQDPKDAPVPSMPESALREVKVDYCVPLSEMPNLLTRLTTEEAPKETEISMKEKNRIEIEVRISAEDNAFGMGIMELGELTPFTCPECHGVLLKLKDKSLLRFRCHTGHAFSANTLLAAVTESIEETLWSTVRAVEESIMLLNHTGKHLAETDRSQLSELYFRKGQEAEQRVQALRQAVLQHEQLSVDGLRQPAEQPEN